MLKIIDIRKAYGSHQVLQGVNLNVSPGAIHGIVGENGAGKSTLFQCIIGTQGYQGTVFFGEKIVKNVTGFLPTEPPMMSRITGYEYLTLVTKARDVIVQDFDEGNIFELPLSRYIDTYSTGMRKKVAITGLLLQKNEIFILDEPFNGLDIQSNVILLAILKKLQAKGKIVLISSHIFSILKEVCDCIHHLKGGQISEVVEKGKFDAFESQMLPADYQLKIDTLNI